AGPNVSATPAGGGEPPGGLSRIGAGGKSPQGLQLVGPGGPSVAPPSRAALPGEPPALWPPVPGATPPPCPPVPLLAAGLNPQAVRTPKQRISPKTARLRIAFTFLGSWPGFKRDRAKNAISSTEAATVAASSAAAPA